MVAKLIILLGLSIASGILYRLGGASGYNTKCRDLGVPFCATGALLAWWRPVEVLGWLMILVSFLALFAALTTYWKKKGTDAHWFNWLLTGLGYSLSALAIVWVTGHWVGFGVRTILLTGLVVLWSESQGNAVWEEFGRGFLITITIPILLL